MKRIIILLLVIAISIGLAACSKKNENQSATPSDEPASDSSGSKVSETQEADYSALAEKLSVQMAGGDFKETCGLFSKTVAAQLDEKTLKSGWDQTVATIGSYVGYYDTTVSEKDGYIIVKSILEYKDSGISVMFTFNKDGKIDGLWTTYYIIPTETVSTDKYAETKIKIGDYQLDGILTLPAEVKNPPVVILIQGSGQHDYNETIGSSKNAPFRDIARMLAEQGIATIRYNKRFYQFAEKAATDDTIEDEVLDDAAAAIAYAKGCADVDGGKIIVLGHSLGGMLAPKISYDNPDVKGFISLAGSPRSLADIIYDQNKEAVNASALSEKEKAKTMKQVQSEVDKVKNLTDSNVGSSGNIFGMSAVYWLSLNKCSGEEFAPKLNIPMLFIQGGADFQVYPDIDFKAWKDLLAGKSNCTFKLYEGLNHLFMKTNGKRDVTEYDPAGTVDSSVINDIATWVKNNI